MRVNVYEHEVTAEVKLVTKDQRDTQGKFVRHMYGLQFVVGPPTRDLENGEYVARSAITFWSSERHLAGDFSRILGELQAQLDGAR
jgi:hypothetical protein